MIVVLIAFYYVTYKGLELGNIYAITKESNRRLEHFLENYPHDETLLQKYKVNQKIDKSYKKYKINHIVSRNIGDSELIVDVIYEIKLLYEEKEVQYKVIHSFTRLHGVEFNISKKELDNGIWIMEWKEL